MNNIIKTRKNKILLTLTVILFAVCNNIMAQKEPYQHSYTRATKDLPPSAVFTKSTIKPVRNINQDFSLLGIIKLTRLAVLILKLPPANTHSKLCLPTKA